MSTQRYTEPGWQEDADQTVKEELLAAEAPADPEKAAARERKLALIEERKVLREKEKARRAVVLSEARARAEQALAAADEELGEAVKDAVETILSERDIASEWAVFDKLQPKVGDPVMVSWNGEPRKGTIEAIDDHADDDAPREWRPLIKVRVRGIKHLQNYRTSALLSITKMVIP